MSHQEHRMESGPNCINALIAGVGQSNVTVDIARGEESAALEVLAAITHALDKTLPQREEQPAFHCSVERVAPTLFRVILESVHAGRLEQLVSTRKRLAREVEGVGFIMANAPSLALEHLKQSTRLTFYLRKIP